MYPREKMVSSVKEDGSEFTNKNDYFCATLMKLTRV
jgi:hypothetical protein